MGMSQVHAKCALCAHKFWMTHYSSEEDDSYSPDKCPKCGGPWQFCDPAESDRRLGELMKCGRCQGTKRNFGNGTVLVTNAPKEIHDSWCHTCIQEVNAGESPIIRGVSIDRKGFVLGSRFESGWLDTLIANALEPSGPECKRCNKDVKRSTFTFACPYCGFVSDEFVLGLLCVMGLGCAMAIYAYLYLSGLWFYVYGIAGSALALASLLLGITVYYTARRLTNLWKLLGGAARNQNEKLSQTRRTKR